MVGSPLIIDEIFDIFKEAPGYALFIEVSLLVVVISLFFIKTRTPNARKYTKEEEEQILAQYTPEPLVSLVPEDHVSLSPRVVNGRVGKRINVDGVDCLNLATHNYLGLLEDKQIEEASIKSLRKYGVGSCGPRGFYGTVDVHLELEERLAKFTNTEDAVVYSYAFSTIASAIAAYSKRKDICYVDEEVNFAIQKGLDASRSKVVYFKHNDMKDLETKLMEQEKEDKRNPKKAASTRKFLIAEAIYINTGEMCPLDKLVELRKKYKLRFFLDESLSFGVLGKRGTGLVEHMNVDRTEIDLISAGLEWAVGSIGGFCVGSNFIVDHQRLSGSGYCFSASLPPLLAQACITALDRFQSNPEMFEELRTVNQELQMKLETLTKLSVRAHPLSPVKHLYLTEAKSREVETQLLEEIVKECQSQGLCLVVSQYLEDKERKCPRPSIRVTANRLLTNSDIAEAVKTIEKVSLQIL